MIDAFIRTNSSGLIVARDGQCNRLDTVENMDPILSWNKDVTKSYILTWCRLILFMFLCAYLPSLSQPLNLIELIMICIKFSDTSIIQQLVSYSTVVSEVSFLEYILDISVSYLKPI